MSADDNVSFSDTQKLRVCRVCLSTNGKFILLTHRIIQVFTEISGISVSRFDGLPQHICSYCLAGLQKCANFKLKCQKANNWLSKHLQHGRLRTQYIKSLDTNCFEHNMSLSKLIYLNLLEEINYSDQNIKVEGVVQIEEDLTDISVKSESDEEFDSIVDAPVHIDEIEIRTDETENDFSEATVSINSDDEDYKVVMVAGDDSDDAKCHSQNYWSIENHQYLTDDSEKLSKEVSLPTTNDAYKRLFPNYVIVIDKRIPSNEDYNSDNETHLDVNDEPIYNDSKLISDDDNTNIETPPNVKKSIELIKSKLRVISEKYNTHVNDEPIYNELEKNDDDDHDNTNKEKPTDINKSIKVIQSKLKVMSKKYKTQEEILNCVKAYNFNVKLLTKTEQINEVKKRKEKRTYMNASFKCEFCFQVFRTERKFKTHMAYHLPSSGAYSCDVCHYRFPEMRLLRKHRLLHKMKLICQQCQAVCKNTTAAREHFRGMHEGVQYPCEHCGKIFQKYGSRINHIRIHHSSTECDICYDMMVGPFGVDLHKSRAHKFVYKCESCDSQFNDEAALTVHLMSYPDGVCDSSLIPCTRCGENFDTDDLLADHKLYHRRKNHKKRKKPLQYVDPLNFRIKPRPKSSDVTASASETADGRKKLLCEMCAYSTYAGAAALRIHQRIHTGERPFECPHCPKKFRMKYLVEAHLRTHTGERPYKCVLCPKAFKMKGALQRHDLIHTGVKSYGCEFCGKTFAQSGSRTVHIKSVHFKIPAPYRIRKKKVA